MQRRGPGRYRDERLRRHYVCCATQVLVSLAEVFLSLGGSSSIPVGVLPFLEAVERLLGPGSGALMPDEGNRPVEGFRAGGRFRNLPRRVGAGTRLLRRQRDCRKILTSVWPITNPRLLRKRTSFPPVALPSLGGTTTLSDALVYHRQDDVGDASYVPNGPLPRAVQRSIHEAHCDEGVEAAEGDAMPGIGDVMNVVEP
jgi:hypothetical protein